MDNDDRWSNGSLEFQPEGRSGNQAYHVVVRTLSTRNEISSKAPWVTDASLFGSFARDEMRPDSDLDLALVAPPSKANRLRTIIEDLSTTTVQRFGNPINAIIGRDSIQAMAQPGVKGYRLWRTIVKEGIPILPAGKDR